MNTDGRHRTQEHDGSRLWLRCHPAYDDWKISTKSFPWTSAGGQMSQSPGCVGSAGEMYSSLVAKETTLESAVASDMLSQIKEKIDTMKAELSTRSKNQSAVDKLSENAADC